MTAIDRQQGAAPPNTGKVERFDEAALRRLAGDTTFARGKAYFRDGVVELLLIEPERVLARVRGTRTYRSELTGRGSRIAGECSCPAFADMGFCKHLVATGLAANVAKETAASGEGALVRIRDHLRRQTVDALVATILDVAARDVALFRKLDLAALASGSAERPDDLRAAIDRATDVPEFDEDFDVAEWVDGVESVLDAVAALVENGKAALALVLAEHAADRIAGADEDLGQYENDGECGALLERAQDIHLGAAEQARPEPVAFARRLFARETRPDGGLVGDPSLYEEVLGEDGLAEYRRLAEADWEKFNSSAKGAAEKRAAPGYHRIEALIDYFAEQDGDVDARIALRAVDLSTPERYRQLAEFCLSQGRKDEALRRVEEGLWVFEDRRPDERFVRFAAELLAKAGRKDEAVAHLWRLFEKAPTSALYAELRKIGREPVRDRCIAFLTARLATKERLGWYAPCDFLVEILTQEKMFEAAWAVSREHKVVPRVKEALALVSEKTHPREATDVYTSRIDALVETGGERNYTEAAQLLRRMAGLRSSGEQAAHIAALKLRYARRRNFLKLLG